MMEVIRDMGVSKTVGFKPAGGVRTAEDAQQFLAIADELFGADWADLPSLPLRRVQPAGKPAEGAGSRRR